MPPNDTTTPINVTTQGPSTSAQPVNTSQGVVYVEQGPVWLVELLYDPAWWVWATVVGVVLVVGVLAAASISRNGGVPEQAQREMLTIGTVALAITGATMVLSATLGLPYWADVVGGAAIGWPVGTVVASELCRGLITEPEAA